MAKCTARLRQHGIADLHFDLPMYLYEQRQRRGILPAEFLPAFEAGGIGTVIASVYIEDRYLRDQALAVALDQITRLHAEVECCDRFAICRSYSEIERVHAAGKVALIIGMEGAEPLGRDIDLLRAFYELGLRTIGLTHARRNAAAAGAAFTPGSSAPDGLTDFGRELVRECERLGILVDLAHINARGFDEILELTFGPPFVSHTNVRKFYDIDRNLSDKQILAIGRRQGLIGINSILVSPRREQSTIDGFVDHIQHVVDLIGIDGVAIGFDFFEFIYRRWPDEARAEFHEKFPNVHFIPDLLNHAHAVNLIAKLFERGFSEEQIEKIFSGNAMRLFRQLL